MVVGAGRHDELHATGTRQLDGRRDARTKRARVFRGAAHELIRAEDDHHRAGRHLSGISGQATPPGGPDPEVRTEEENSQEGEKQTHPSFEPSRHGNHHYAQKTVGKGVYLGWLA
jgi:hypothetical protein